MSAARKVLLVDDEPRVVAGLQRLLRPHRAQWDVSVATSAAEGLAILERDAFDVVVSDMRMPVTDGAAFLSVIRERHPAIMRIVLSGQTDADVAQRAVPVAHQFLSKPTDPVSLLETLRRVTATRAAISDPKVHAAVGSVGALPSLPSICKELMDLVSKDDLSVRSIAAIVEREPAIVLKLLQVVNSSFFGVRRKICNVAEAVAYIGTERVKNLVMSLSIVNSLPPRARRFDATAFHAHSLAVARLARSIAVDGALAESSFVAGLLHEVGKLVMAASMPELFDDLSARAVEQRITFEEAELEAGSCGHVRVGAYLLEIWGLPFAIVETLVAHVDAPALEGSRMEPWDAVHLAHRLVEPGAEPLGSEADLPYLRRLGLVERLPALLAEAAEATGR